MKKSVFWCSWLAIIIVSLLARCYQLNFRLLHNDEAVNHYFLQQTKNLGYFPYSHENYHGPAYFYLTYATFKAVTFLRHGNNDEASLRASACLAGLVSIGLLLLLRKYEGDTFVLLASLFVGLTPSLLYYSRYAIHETLFALAGEIVALSLYLYIKGAKSWVIHFGWFGVALLVTTKETFIITLFVIGLAALLSGVGLAVCKKILADQLHFYWGMLTAVFLILLTFSAGFTWLEGLREMVLAIPQWVSRNKSDTGHFKPFWYYLVSILIRTDPHLIIGFALGASYCMWDGVCNRFSEQGRFARFVFLWALFSCLVYSKLSYKTPWLVVNISLPLAILLAWLISRAPLRRSLNISLAFGFVALIACLCLANQLSSNLWLVDLFGEGNIEYFEQAKTSLLNLWLWSNSAAFVLAILPIIAILLSLLFAVFGSKNLKFLRGSLAVTSVIWIVGCDYYYNIQDPHSSTNPLSYVHSQPGLRTLMHKIDAYWQKNPNARLLVGIDGYWPIPYYIRNRASQVAYQTDAQLDHYQDQYQIILQEFSGDKDQPISAEESEKWERVYYRVSDVEETWAYFRK